MNTQNQARAMMMHRTQSIRNRQQSMLGRTSAEMGLDIEKNTTPKTFKAN